MGICRAAILRTRLNQKAKMELATKRRKRLKNTAEKHAIAGRNQFVMQVKPLGRTRPECALGFVLFVPFCGYSNPGI